MPTEDADGIHQFVSELTWRKMGLQERETYIAKITTHSKDMERSAKAILSLTKKLNKKYE